MRRITKTISFTGLLSLVLIYILFAYEPVKVYTPRPKIAPFKVRMNFSRLSIPPIGIPDKSQGGLHYSEDGKFTIPFGKSYNYTNILVTRVVDGDTLKLENGERVRLIGIDTPEMHESQKLYRDSARSKQDISTIQKLGRRAYEFTKNLVEGKRVSLEFDVEKHDRYGRLLAYVYLKDGTFVNAKIVEEGYASLMTFPPNVKYADLFLKLHQEARNSRKGLW